MLLRFIYVVFTCRSYFLLLSIFFFYCCITNYHKRNGIRQQYIYYFTVSMGKELGVWLNWVFSSEVHKAESCMSAGLHSFLMLGSPSKLKEAEFWSLLLWEWGPHILVDCDPGLLSGLRGPCISLPHGPLTNLTIWKLTSSKPAGECLPSIEKPSPTFKCFHLLTLGISRIISHLTQNQLIWNFNYIYKNSFTKPHNTAQPQEWHPIRLTGSAHTQGEEIIQGIYIYGCESWRSS